MTLASSERPMLLRELIGESLRDVRADRSLTLREVSAKARVSLGYLSEVERGQKEASSELLNAICAALDVSLVDVLAMVGNRLAPNADVTPLPLPRSHAAAA